MGTEIIQLRDVPAEETEVLWKRAVSRNMSLLTENRKYAKAAGHAATIEAFS